MPRASEGPVPSAPTIYDVAKHAGVSIATVSRVLNGHGHLRPATRDRVLASVQELHYVPSGPARQLSTRTTKIVALSFVRPPEEVSQVEDDVLLFSDAVIRGAELAAQKHGYSLLLSGVKEGGPSQPVVALTGRADGLMVLDRVLNERTIASLSRRYPIVVLTGTGTTSAVNVRVDNAHGMEELAEHLISHHKLSRFAFMAGRAGSPDSAARERAFGWAVRRRGGVLLPGGEAWTADWAAVAAAARMRQFLASGQELPDAVVCANDLMALGVIQAAHSAGLRVPEDLRVTGFDDIPLARHLTPALTTVRQPSQQLGAVGVDVLISLIERRPDAGQDKVLPTELVVRASCGCSAPGDGGLGLLEH